MMRTSLRLLIALGCFGLASAAAQETIYPSKPIHIVVAVTPGGVTDILGRALARRLAETWRQQVIVENRAGAYNIIGAEYVAKGARRERSLRSSTPRRSVSSTMRHSGRRYSPRSCSSRSPARRSSSPSSSGPRR